MSEVFWVTDEYFIASVPRPVRCRLDNEMFPIEDGKEWSKYFCDVSFPEHEWANVPKEKMPKWVEHDIENGFIHFHVPHHIEKQAVVEYAVVVAREMVRWLDAWYWNQYGQSLEEYLHGDE